MLYALLAHMPTAVIETHWHPELSGPRLRSMGRPILEVFCRSDRETRIGRLGVRDRHPGHLESRFNLLPMSVKQRMNLGHEEPLALGGPLLEVDTTAPVEAASVAEWVLANIRA